MPRLFRLLCVCLGVTVVVALQAHGAVTARHQIEHSLQFPGVAYEQTAAVEHDHDHEQVVVDVDQDAAAIDVAGSDGDTPIKHHHHSGGDVHLALAALEHPLNFAFAGQADLGPHPSSALPGVSGDGPTHPPKQQRA